MMMPDELPTLPPPPRATPVELDARVQPRQRRAQEKRDAILAATEALLAEREVADISTTLIAAKAGVPVGLIYRYFPNKFAILSELARQAMDLVDTRLEALMVEGQADIAAAIAGGIDTILQTYREEPAARRLFRTIRTTPELAGVLAQSNERMVDALRGALRALRPDAGPARAEAVARTTVQVYTHLEALAIDCEDPALFPLLVAEWKRLATLYVADFAGGR